MPLLPPAAGMAELLRTRQVLVADFPAVAMDVESLQACARELVGTVDADAVLLGDSGAARVQFSPSLRAQLVQQQGVAAWVCFVNHCGPADRVREFVSRTTDLGGPPVDFIACVPVVVDGGSAARLASFTSLVLPDGFLDRILAAADPHREGVRAAVELGPQLLDVRGTCARSPMTRSPGWPPRE